VRVSKLVQQKFNRQVIPLLDHYSDGSLPVVKLVYVINVRSSEYKLRTHIVVLLEQVVEEGSETIWIL
jgi:hypothetical protein